MDDWYFRKGISVVKVAGESWVERFPLEITPVAYSHFIYIKRMLGIKKRIKYLRTKNKGSWCGCTQGFDPRSLGLTPERARHTNHRCPIAFMVRHIIYFFAKKTHYTSQKYINPQRITSAHRH